MTVSTKPWLIADIGGTNSRVACWEPGSSPRRLLDLRRYRNSQHDSLDALLLDYLDSLPPDRRPHAAALAIAAPLRGTTVRMLNLDWEFKITALRDTLALAELDVINDFHAQAFALPVLGDEDRIGLGRGQAITGKAIAVLGPGTGLGVGGLTPSDGGYAAVTGEGGHVTLAASNDFEAELIARIRARIGHCSAERILSGNGLELLHNVLHGGDAVRAEEISTRARRGDPAAAQTFGVFFDFLGTVAADLALTLGALGGVYVAGGIALVNQELFLASGFRERFIDKGRYREYLDAIPTWLVTADYPALFGLASYVGQRLRYVSLTGSMG